MIDEKNLNKEAEYYAKSVFRYYEAAHACKLGFIAGAEWAQKEFINSLWHDASEEPTKRKLILFETDTLSGLVDLIVWDKQDDWVLWSYKQHINKWLYVTDLFIKK